MVDQPDPIGEPRGSLPANEQPPAPSGGLIVQRADRAASPVEVGATVYPCKLWDYGCANEDTRHSGIEHVSVTLDPSGDYPFFTIPRADLAKAEGR